ASPCAQKRKMSDRNTRDRFAADGRVHFICCLPARRRSNDLFVDNRCPSR
ncbi:hypothetical protein V3C99_008569, partial [Haemonchus contortus]